MSYADDKIEELVAKVEEVKRDYIVTWNQYEILKKRVDKTSSRLEALENEKRKC